MKLYKLLLTVSFLLNGAIYSYSQHISFNGIQLGQQRAAFEKGLNNKGYRLKESSRYFDTYTGSFWKFSTCDVVLWKHDDPVSSVMIEAAGDRNKYYELVSSLNKKYGVGRETGFPAIMRKNRISDYEWVTAGGIISSSYREPTELDKRKSIIQPGIISITYRDASSISNPDDDL